MAYDKAQGKMAPNTTASKQARSVTAGPNGSFPVGDAKHARLALSAAERSKNAGNISPEMAARIEREARAQLAKKAPKPKPAPKPAPKSATRKGQ